MKKRIVIAALAAAVALGLGGCQTSFQVSHDANYTQQSQLDYMASALQVHFQVVKNLGATSQSSPMHQVNLRVVNRGSQPIHSGDWHLYLQSIYPIDTLESPLFTAQHLQGTLNQLTPSQDFILAPGQSVVLLMTLPNWQVSYSDFMPRAYVSAKGRTPRVLDNTDVPRFALDEKLQRYVDPITNPDQYKRAPNDQYHPFTVEELFSQNRSVQSLPAEVVSRHIIPTPLVTQVTNVVQKVALNKDWVIVYQRGLQAEAEYLAGQLAALFGVAPKIEPSHYQYKHLKTINLDYGAVKLPKGSEKLIATEAYRLHTSLYRVEITGTTSNGVFDGIQSLLALVPGFNYLKSQTEILLPQLKVVDAPRMEFRGLLVDVARNFKSVHEIKKVLDMMAALKMNRLHLHLSDDEGWRLAIPELPELTQIGARRCHDLSEQRCLLPQLGSDPAYDSEDAGSGYYSREQFIDLLQYAWRRHILIVPEFDMPGHARAAIVAMKARYSRLIKKGRDSDAEEFLLSDLKDRSKYLSIQNFDDNALNVCLPSSHNFIRTLIDSVAETYKMANVPLRYWHMGNDEVPDGSWIGSPACKKAYPELSTKDEKAYRHRLTEDFVKFISQILAQKGITMGSWNDGMKIGPDRYMPRSLLASDAYVNAWDSTAWPPVTSPKLLDKSGYKAVISLSSQLYFDHPYAPDPRERGFYWAGRYTNTQEVFAFTPENLEGVREGTPMGTLGRVGIMGENESSKWKNQSASQNALLGMLAGAWGETIRNDNQLDYMLFPRTVALAERAWHRAPWESNLPNSRVRFKDWQLFANAMGHNWIPRMVSQGVMLRLPPPGAMLKGGRLFANTPYPGLGIQYNQGQGWQDYQSAIGVGQKLVELRSVVYGDGKVVRNSLNTSVVNP